MTAVSPRTLRAAQWTAALTAAGYLLFSLWSGWADVWRAVTAVGPGGFAAALALSAVNYTLRFYRWDTYLRALGHALPRRDHAWVYLSGFAWTATPGKAGEMLRGVFLTRRGVPAELGVAAFVAERSADLLAVLLLAFPAAWLFPAYRPLLLALAAGLFLLVVAAHQSARLARLPGVAGLVGQRLAAAADALKVCYRLRSGWTGVFVGLIAWSAEGLALWVLLGQMGADVGVVRALFIYAVSMLAGAVSMLPGGVGGAEVAMVSLLMGEGLGHGDAAAVTILARLATLWFAVGLGVYALRRVS
ncbi:lysylphosphatidylglycerol synthase transmembrane domain-containing protein [Deinococcus soli (ex Cha et al. 2016)]|uniref:Uncharacterized membrane protein YbhN (UPF0104 family) n=2 Tax=Deinococcus soli (ex Cha et al. 2016) TaxID=1309411 RepID=A0AAE4BN88_9DEIO|nr:lysylphosphatidylglycerol synthase transmembrane domain-containing protein [Deinococcus soli (ex Cha et al. 2016)]MDR6218481.1 uncharacterized membrane protein YbhN (UPF0104 family) [Deinococcus soli (ex Cha et al. 2016)]MDR6329221.1 uncharacterized membrane protein YbhN (UPF0104 family) [Deinococcus soli (ex Cha et al. 2016)]MDR6751494.1 uncharacterized membrane protein YbhN (UPF0104 family) [Deinococcus soli (ex Cha et al. 2016)]